MQSHQQKRAAGNATPSDSNFKQTVLLLHGDGTNGSQNNTFLDSSTNNFTITRNGNTTQGSFSPFSQTGWSNYFDGSGDYISVADSADFTMGSGDFTVELFAYSTVNSSSDQYICGQVPSSGAAASTSFQIYKKATTNVVECYVYIGGAKVATSSATLSINQWTHIAMVRDGGTMRLYLNGVQDGTNTTLSTSSIVDSTGSFAVGRTGDYNGLYFAGYVSNARVIKGTCLYPNGTTFTPPSSNFSTSTSGQSVLLCRENRFIDSNTATTAKTVTIGGDTKVQPFSPFAPTVEYSTSSIGGSAYFDGSGDYLTLSGNPTLTTNFTIEFWFYVPSWGDRVFFSQGGSAANFNTSNGVAFQIYSTSTTFYVQWSNGAGSFGEINTATSGIAINAWHHFAVCNNGTRTRFWIDGTTTATSTTYPTWGYPTTRSTYIGYISYTSSYVGLGYISGLRVVTSDVYDATNTSITVPTAPLTAITNTALLCNFTNAAIFDSTAKNDLETVGNAQISTSVKKFGTGSLAFDGTGDWLTVLDNPDLQLNTGNFTIELWVYLASGDTGSARGLVSKGTSTTGWSVSLDTSQKVVFSYSSSTITSTGAITTNAWNHVAVVREGTGTNQTKIYIAGTNDGTGTVSTDFNQTNIMYIGADRAGGSAMKGNIDDLRITKGVARYTANFTAPTSAFANK